MKLTKYIFGASILSISMILSCNSKIPSQTMPDTLTNSVEHNFKGKIIIIGAGAAGLSAANVLENSNVDYQILEATNHYGGRIRMNDTFADFPIDIGAEWIHDKKALLNRLKGIEGNKVDEDVILYQPMDIYTWNGKDYDKIPVKQLKKGYSKFQEYKFKNSTWFQFIDANFAQNVKENIIYNSPVSKIDYSKNQVVVTTNDGKEYTADKVILTVSIGVLQANTIEFQPILPTKKVEAINSVIFPKGFKLFMKFSEKFYPDMISCKTEVGEKSYYDVAYHKDANDNIFGLLSTGTSAEEYYQLGSQQKIVEAVLKELDIIFDGKASKYYLDEYILKDWGKQQFTLGTWTEDYDMYKWLLAPLGENKVYFSGETYAGEYNSTVHGAIISGNKTAIKLLHDN